MRVIGRRGKEFSGWRWVRRGRREKREKSIGEWKHEWLRRDKEKPVSLWRGVLCPRESIHTPITIFSSVCMPMCWSLCLLFPIFYIYFSVFLFVMTSTCKTRPPPRSSVPLTSRFLCSLLLVWFLSVPPSPHLPLPLSSASPPVQCSLSFQHNRSPLNYVTLFHEIRNIRSFHKLLFFFLASSSPPPRPLLASPFRSHIKNLPSTPRFWRSLLRASLSFKLNLPFLRSLPLINTFSLPLPFHLFPHACPIPA